MAAIHSLAIRGDARPESRHVNFDLIRTVNLGPADFEPMKVSLGEPEV